MLLKKASRSWEHQRPFEINSRQCSCCLAIPHRLQPVVIRDKISYLCDSCYAQYNSGRPVMLLNPRVV